MFSTVCIPQHPALRSSSLSPFHFLLLSPSLSLFLPRSLFLSLFPHSLFLSHCDSCCVLCAKILLKVFHKSYPQFWLPQRIQGMASSRCHPHPVAAPPSPCHSSHLPLYPTLALSTLSLSPDASRGGAYQLFRQINHKTSYRT